MARKSSGGYYAVKRGRRVGVFHDWDSCEEQVKGYSGAQFKKFQTEEEALNFVKSGNNQTSEAKCNSESLRINYVNTVTNHENPREKMSFPTSNHNYHKGKFYAVKVGYRPGIYPTWEECQKQVSGFSGARFKSFKTLEEAENFVHYGMYDPFVNPIVEEPPEDYSNLPSKDEGASKLTKLTLTLGPTVSSASIPTFFKRSEEVAIELPLAASSATISPSSAGTGEEDQKISGSGSFWDKFQTKFTALNQKRMSDEAFGSSSMTRWDEFERLSGSEDDEPVKTLLRATEEDDEDEDEVVFVKQIKKRKGH